MSFATVEQRNAYFREYKRRRRDEAIALLGGACVKCGTSENLHIDHIDPDTKEYRITDVLWYRREVREAELAKCQLLCEGDHKFKTLLLDPVREIPF
jgi:5-methylcytosine-specific restriction endonuclease McrA